MATINGKELKTTFWEDFTKADWFGSAAIKDTYKRSIEDWGDNIDYMKEFVLVLNHKSWEHFEMSSEHDGRKHARLSEVYSELYHKSDDYCWKHFQDDKEALAEYYRFLD